MPSQLNSCGVPRVKFSPVEVDTHLEYAASALTSIPALAMLFPQSCCAMNTRMVPR